LTFDNFPDATFPPTVQVSFVWKINTSLDYKGVLFTHTTTTTKTATHMTMTMAIARQMILSAAIILLFQSIDTSSQEVITAVRKNVMCAK
jgi:hypothetical protein